MDHEHVFGPVEHARYTGNPHRKCQVDGCRFVSLDLEEDAPERQTWMDDESLVYPSGALRDSQRRARVLCGDGKLRTAIVGIPDTYFTVPARVKAYGRTISGYVSTLDWSDVETYDHAREGELAFHPNRSGRNAELIPWIPAGNELLPIAERACERCGYAPMRPYLTLREPCPFVLIQFDRTRAVCDACADRWREAGLLIGSMSDCLARLGVTV